MKKENLYLVAISNRYLLKKTDNLICMLNNTDIEALSLSLEKSTPCGSLEVDKEALYSLSIIAAPDISYDTKKYILLSSKELFEEKLHPAERLALSKMVSGATDIRLVTFVRDGKLMNAYERVSISRTKAFFSHLHTVNRHRRLVRKHCFKVGLYYQGLTHDLSKYSPTEFLPGVKYYQGTRSPNVAERSINGYSTAWIHHKGRNKHHYEYWTDYSFVTGNPLEYCKMPKRYFVESLMDRIAASKVYRGKLYNDGDALDYLLTRDSESHMHPDNHSELVRILTMLKNKGEKETFRYIKEIYLKEKE